MSKDRTSQAPRTFSQKHPNARYYVGMIALSLLFNWFMQLGYYLYKTHFNPHAFDGERTLFDYTTGIIGDVIVVPLINVAVLYILLHAEIRLKLRAIMGVAAGGLLIDVTTHFFQGYLGLTNWSMPRPFEWDFVSYWHMVSYFFQMSFIVLFFYLVAKGAFRRGEGVRNATRSGFALMAVFVMLFVWDYLPLHAWSSQLLAYAHSFIR